MKESEKYKKLVGEEFGYNEKDIFCHKQVGADTWIPLDKYMSWVLVKPLILKRYCKCDPSVSVPSSFFIQLPNIVSISLSVNRSCGFMELTNKAGLSSVLSTDISLDVK